MTVLQRHQQLKSDPFLFNGVEKRTSAEAIVQIVHEERPNEKRCAVRFFHRLIGLCIVVFLKCSSDDGERVRVCERESVCVC